MNLRRGGVRLAIAAATLWFIFWTVAYVIHPYSSLRIEPSYSDRVSAPDVVVPCLVAAIVLGAWVVAGLWPEARGPGPGDSA